MVVQGKISRIIPNGVKSLVEFEVFTYQAEHINKLDKEETYSLNIKKATSKKSLNQNNYAWSLMNEIASELDIFPDAMSVYLDVLKRAKIKTSVFSITDESFISEEVPTVEDVTDDIIIEELLHSYRAVRILERKVNERGYPVSVVEGMVGMSTFGKDKMSRFIEALLYFAEMNNVDTSRYDFER